MGAPPEQKLSVSLNLTPQLVADLGRETGALTVAQTYVIDSPEMAVEANTELQDVKRRLKLVEDWRERFLAPVRQLTDTANEFFNPARQALQGAEAHLKTALLGWNKKEEERVAAERRNAEEAARRARAEAEAQAAAQRARAQQEADEKRRQAALAEAERQRQEREAVRLRAEGNAKAAAEAARAAATAAAESAKREEEAQAKIEAGEAKAQQTTMAAAAIPMEVVAGPAKLAGFGSRENWGAELAPGKTEDEVKVAICSAIAGGRTDLFALIALDMKAAGKLAKALKANFNVPGLNAVNRPVAASRAA